MIKHQMRTEDGVAILPGARLFNYYDMWWGYVDPGLWDRQRHPHGTHAPDGERFDGWIELIQEDDVIRLPDGSIDWDATRQSGARRKLLNGQRLASYDPRTRRRVTGL